MSESPEVCQFSSTEVTSQHCYNVSASNWIQRFFKGLGTFAFTNYVKITALVKNTRTFSSYFVIFLLNRFYTPAHSDLQYLAMNNHFCIPDWLPKETVQVSDCNFDPAPPEILLFTAKRRRFKAFIKPSAGFTLDIPNEQPSLDWIGTG